jgi:hypothetical protein
LIVVGVFSPRPEGMGGSELGGRRSISIANSDSKILALRIMVDCV